VSSPGHHEDGIRPCAALMNRFVEWFGSVSGLLYMPIAW
jgi:hypothetical protein